MQSPNIKKTPAAPKKAVKNNIAAAASNKENNDDDYSPAAPVTVFYYLLVSGITGHVEIISTSLDRAMYEHWSGRCENMCRCMVFKADGKFKDVEIVFNGDIDGKPCGWRTNREAYASTINTAPQTDVVVVFDRRNVHFHNINYTSLPAHPKWWNDLSGVGDIVGIFKDFDAAFINHFDSRARCRLCEVDRCDCVVFPVKLNSAVDMESFIYADDNNNDIVYLAKFFQENYTTASYKEKLIAALGNQADEDVAIDAKMRIARMGNVERKDVYYFLTQGEQNEACVVTTTMHRALYCHAQGECIGVCDCAVYMLHARSSQPVKVFDGSVRNATKNACLAQAYKTPHDYYHLNRAFVNVALRGGADLIRISDDFDQIVKTHSCEDAICACVIARVKLNCWIDEDGDRLLIRDNQEQPPAKKMRTTRNVIYYQ